MFWTCPRLTDYWSNVFKTLEQAFNTNIDPRYSLMEGERWTLFFPNDLLYLLHFRIYASFLFTHVMYHFYHHIMLNFIYLFILLYFTFLNVFHFYFFILLCDHDQHGGSEGGSVLCVFFCPWHLVISCIFCNVCWKQIKKLKKGLSWHAGTGVWHFDDVLCYFVNCLNFFFNVFLITEKHCSQNPALYH